MRCPKCQYISFDSGDRCRNCGYQFSLAVEEPPVEVTIGRDEPGPGRVGELSDRALGAPRRQFTAADLPLFTDRVADDQAPLVTPPAVPRPPLAVRRANPGLHPRHRAPRPEELSLDLAAGPGTVEEPESADALERFGDAAGIVRRVAAGLIDSTILGAILAAVVYLTLRLCDLTPDQWRALPAIPLGAFLLLLAGGYFVLFTAAGGQTIGKMATRIRVVAVPADGEGPLRVSFGAAVFRTVVCLASVAPLGAGFLPVLFRADRRAFHDRVADTRVVIA